MFDNVGGKIRGLAIIQLILGCIGSIVLAVILAVEIDVLSLLIGLVGIAVSIVNALLLDGLGQLVENSDIIIDLLRNKETGTSNRPSSTEENNYLTRLAHEKKETGTSNRPSSTTENNYLTRLAHEKKEGNTSTASHYWTCEKCGCKNPKTSTSCRDCGDARY